MNIAFVINQLIVGGAEQYVITKSEWLIRKGYNVIVISEGGVWESKLPEGVKHFRLKGIMQSPYSIGKQDYNLLLLTLSSILINNKIDIIEGQNTWPILHVINSYSIHGIPYYMNILLELSYYRNYLLQYATRYMSRQKLYYTLTEKMNTYIESKCKEKLNPTIINIPISQQTGVNIEDDKYILSVCRLVPEKMYVKSLINGFTDLIVNNKEIKHKLIIVGDGELFDEIRILVNNNNNRIGEERIVIKGTVEGIELTKLFSRCTVYVGMGTTLLIAASVHKPCIICGFEPKTMNMAWGFWGDNEKADKDEIVYTQSSIHRNEENFESILRRLLGSNDLRKEKAINAYNLFTKFYSIESVMEKWEKEYVRLIDNQHPKELKFISRKMLWVSNLYRYIYKIYSLKKVLIK